MRKKIRRGPAWVLAILGVIQVGEARPAYALSCGAPMSYAQALAKADEVFVGLVRKVRKKASLIERTRMNVWNVWLVVTGNGSAERDRSAEGRVVEMSVLERFKGPSGATAGILIDDDDTWEFPYASGDRYVVFGHQIEGALLFASVCGPTAKLPEGDTIVGEVRKLVGSSSR